MYKVDNDLLSIQEARICIESAREAASILLSFSQSQLDSIVEQLSKAIDKQADQLAESAVEETGYGCLADKKVKNRFICNYLPEKMRNERYVGVLNEDTSNKTIDIGIPIGPVIAIPPATSPTATTIHNVLIAIKSGNPIIVAPHPRAKNVIQQTAALLCEAGKNAGLPEGTIQCMQMVSLSGTKELINHEDSALALVTGVPKLLPIVKQAAKPFIYGGSGNGPVFIERSCDIRQAVNSIIISRTFDYGIVSAAEQSIVVDGPIIEEVRAEFLKQGTYFINKEEAARLEQVLFTQEKTINAEAVGLSAVALAKTAQIAVPKETKLLVYEQEYISESNPFTQEILCPVVAMYVEDDWQHACEKCIELLMENGKSHTLVIHSKDEAVIREFALKKPVSRVLVNTPSTFGGMGATTNLFPSMTLGSVALGTDEASDNISPRHLTRIRKVGYGVRNISDCLQPFITNGTEAKDKKEDKTDLDEIEDVIRRMIDILE
ncbi:aldehyde dehydrogenase family protein [Enterococcus sp. BWR-S5]|uniref:aldehyde dehydrogenase family protein n=1 Tax=Enterococcus sp. BWR-S5 TaxID=2787714 RepID=UPI00192336C7|nr:aldehyde dehydrogenase family protein [Enterococcus sp. BWR-S5]MBL1224683.1 aldehyde dehydrogenase family protein [Enterococcus sp. BWR-S5]